MTDLADKLQPGIRYMQNKLQEVHDYLDNMGPTIRLNTGWQPIETAPKDGTPILVLERYSSMRNGPIDRHYIEIARWDNGWRIDAFAPPMDKDPTHWVFLPEPPKEGL